MSTSGASSRLFDPLQVGDITLQHRVIMAPLTRYRADKNHVHGDLAVQYYGQRAEVPGTLLITEATFIAAEAGGYEYIPGIWNEAQIAAWKRIVEAVHSKGSFIFLQLWALGRSAEPKVLAAEGLPYVSSSPIPLTGIPEVPRELAKEDIRRYVGLYAQAAKNAVEKAGFDGVEIHSANGYLLDQFLQDVCNKRTDEYGGSVENRTRFTLEVTDAVVAAIGVKKTAIRFSPWSRFQDMRMDDPIPTFSYLMEQLAQRHPELAYVHFVEPRVSGDNEVGHAHEVGTPKHPDSNDFARKIWGSRPLLIAGGYKPDTAAAAAEQYPNAGIVFGRYFLANPDLPERLRMGIALNHYDRKTFYTNGAEGYIDYPRAAKVTA
ncbi:inactive dehydrogenase EasA [Ceratobasidium theobromae]|uniref:Inactive dehydrogenase EasA n=1 Tax=Ceratobasidium theobromae TaxID=1582974 RepID=A0A5N5Q918_9AGAM|nr:inactive dehydrogenase EasA [Ceratobasidium theobromae]